MIMIEQSRRLSEPLRWGRREKTVVAVLLGCVVLALVGLGAFALTAARPARKDCVEVDVREHAGRRQLHACGAKASGICASPARSTRSRRQLRRRPASGPDSRSAAS